MPKLTKAEKETIVRWDELDRTLDIYTASETFAKKLQKRGYNMQADKPWGWRVKGIPLKAISFRRLGTADPLIASAAKKRGLPPALRASIEARKAARVAGGA